MRRQLFWEVIVKHCKRNWKSWMGMKNKIPLILLAAGIMTSCASLRKSSNIQFSGVDELYHFCDTMNEIESLFIGKIDAVFEIEEETYDAKLTVYYVPDSMLFISASNTGFEIVRALITPDSLILINRLDKLVYFQHFNTSDNVDPVNFQDVEFLINKLHICAYKAQLNLDENRIFLDRSVQDVTKVIQYRVNDLKIERFEFFQKKTNEYVVGEVNEKDELIIYSNYVMDDVKIIAKKGSVEVNRKVEVNMDVNKRKYIFIELL
jgi:hypothetical protein